MPKYLLKNGLIIDGSGREGYRADILMESGSITRIGEIKFENDAVVYDCTGLCIVPGFIDSHSHSDLVAFMELSAFNVLEQGITTEITGNCGSSLIPFIDDINFSGEMLPEHKKNIMKNGADAKAIMDELEAVPMPTNFALFIGHGNVRFGVMGYSLDEPTREQLEQMQLLIREGMSQGAFGLSTGLIYPPSSYAKENELISLCRTVAEYKGYYASHIRSESGLVVEGVEEAIRIGEAAGVPVEISHHKVVGKANKGKSVETLKLIDEANERGQRIGLDQYPYNGGATALINALPPKYAVNGLHGILNALQDAETRRKIIQQLKEESDEFENMIYECGSFDNILINCLYTKQYSGMSIQQAADTMKKNPFDAIFDLLLENKGEVDAIFIDINDWDIENIMKYPRTMGGVDGLHIQLRGEARHPRLRATFPRIIGTYCRDKKLMNPESCIRRLTGLPAEFFGLKSKGLIQEGKDADIVVFDFDSLAGNADYSHSTAANTGIRYVFVNGALAVKDGTVTGIKNGRLLRKAIQ